jgi:hypothetical protein
MHHRYDQVDENISWWEGHEGAVSIPGGLCIANLSRADLNFWNLESRPRI